MQITLKNLERLMLMILKDLRRLPKIGTMLILKRKEMHPKRHTKKYKEAFKADYCEYREQICSKKREEYVLHPNL